MRAGAPPRLDQRVQILAPKVQKNGLGEMISTGWAVTGRARAEVTPISDGERLRAAAVEQKADARFVLRALKATAQITGRFALRYGGDVWQISGVKPLGRGFIEITAWRRITGDLPDVG